VPTYHRQKRQRFSVQFDIVIPNEALQQFGIDVYADLRYDTWVLFAISARLDNNSWSNPSCASLNPLFSLFNHSCEPNVHWSSSRDHRTIKITASRDLVKGEQLFVEYDSFEHDKPVAQRRKRLARWIDGPCLCMRCVREEREIGVGKLEGGRVPAESVSLGDTF